MPASEPTHARAILLAVSTSEHQSRAHDNQHYANRGRDFLVMLGGDSDVGIAYADAVMMHVRKRYDERNNSQDQNHNPDRKQRFH
jgi:hypothetical protein